MEDSLPLSVLRDGEEEQEHATTRRHPVSLPNALLPSHSFRIGALPRVTDAWGPNIVNREDVSGIVVFVHVSWDGRLARRKDIQEG